MAAAGAARKNVLAGFSGLPIVHHLPAYGYTAWRIAGWEPLRCIVAHAHADANLAANPKLSV